MVITRSVLICAYANVGSIKSTVSIFLIIVGSNLLETEQK